MSSSTRVVLVVVLFCFVLLFLCCCCSAFFMAAAREGSQATLRSEGVPPEVEWRLEQFFRWLERTMRGTKFYRNFR